MRGHRLLALGVVITTASLLVVATALAQLTPGVPDDMRLPRVSVFVVLAFAVALNGALILWHRPANRIGWILCASGLAGATEHLVGSYAGAAIFGSVGLPGAEAAAWTFSWLEVFHLGPLGTFVLLLFPDGHLPSRRWAPVAWVAGGALVAIAVGVAFLPGPIPVIGIANPLGLPELAGPLMLLLSIGFVSGALAAVLCAFSLVRRYGRASGIERHQIKWVAYASVVAVIGLLVFLILGLSLQTGALVTSLATIPLPTAMSIAILRYRLYDIDLLINRTLVYSATIATIGAGFVIVVLGLQTALRPLTGGSDLAVAGSTLLTLALFQPVRRRIQAAVDRRFYRSRYDAARTLDAFSTRMRDQLDIEAVRGEVLDVVDATLRPAHASLWLRSRTR